MAKFTFNGSQEMIYPNIVINDTVLVAEPGQSYDLDSAPDADWSIVTTPKASPAADPTATTN